MVHQKYININTQLEDSQGNPIRDHGSIAKELTNYYKDVLTKPIKDISPTICKITRHIPSVVTHEKNEALTRTITKEEVDNAFKEIFLGKSPGLDGFTTNFFHYCWSMIREEV